jgi:hypothetical protein
MVNVRYGFGGPETNPGKLKAPEAKLPTSLSVADLKKGGAKMVDADGFKKRLCITRAQYDALPDGTQLQVAHLQPGMRSSIVTKGNVLDRINLTETNGVIGYGFDVPDTTEAEVAGRVSDMRNMTAEEAANWSLKS